MGEQLLSDFLRLTSGVIVRDMDIDKVYVKLKNLSNIPQPLTVKLIDVDLSPEEITDIRELTVPRLCIATEIFELSNLNRFELIIEASNKIGQSINANLEIPKAIDFKQC